MSSCFGFRKSKSDETEPLLPVYRDDTVLQRELHQKLHSYQMIRAIKDGYMPSNEQLIVNLRTLLSSDVLNPKDPNLSDSGRRLAKFSKLWLKDFIELLVHKNSEDQIQDFLWSLSHSKVHVDVEDLAQRAYKAKSKAKTAAGKYRYSQFCITIMLTLHSLPKPANRRIPPSYQLRLPHLPLGSEHCRPRGLQGCCFLPV